MYAMCNTLPCVADVSILKAQEARKGLKSERCKRNRRSFFRVCKESDMLRSLVTYDSRHEAGEGSLRHFPTLIPFCNQSEILPLKWIALNGRNLQFKALSIILRFYCTLRLFFSIFNRLRNDAVFCSAKTVNSFKISAQ